MNSSRRTERDVVLRRAGITVLFEPPPTGAPIVKFLFYQPGRRAAQRDQPQTICTSYLLTTGAYSLQGTTTYASLSTSCVCRPITAIPNARLPKQYPKSAYEVKSKPQFTTRNFFRPPSHKESEQRSRRFPNPYPYNANPARTMTSTDFSKKPAIMLTFFRSSTLFENTAHVCLL